MIIIDYEKCCWKDEKCVGCGLCVAACDHDVIRMADAN